jgi:hypothetical protein
LVETILEVYSQCSRVVYLLDTSAVRFGYPAARLVVLLSQGVIVRRAAYLRRDLAVEQVAV